MSEIYIEGAGTISPMGSTLEEVFSFFKRGKTAIKPRLINDTLTPVAALGEDEEALLTELRGEEKRFSDLDRTVLMAITSAREAVHCAEWNSKKNEIGVNIGSSRGATERFEQFHSNYLKGGQAAIPVNSSPITTLGNISSWVAQDLIASGPAVSHSVTCSTSLHAFGNALAWMRSGMCQKFLVGGAEAPLGGFTIAQMRALRIYSQLTEDEFPCRPCGTTVKGAPAKNTLVLGEGSAVFALGMNPKNPPLAKIESFGWGVEPIESSTGITDEGLGLQLSMRRAIESASENSEMDLVVLHAPGTKGGDEAELSAVEAVFGENRPDLFSTKWMTGHTFGASGAISVLYALYLLSGGDPVSIPYPSVIQNRKRDFKRIMVNSAGFGGNAASLILSRA